MLACVVFFFAMCFSRTVIGTQLFRLCFVQTSDTTCKLWAADFLH